MSRKEYQCKVEGILDRSLLFSLQAEPLGQLSQKDTYLAGGSTRRIRSEADQYIYAEKADDTGLRARVKDVSERPIEKAEVKHLIRRWGVLATICKTRTFYRLGNAIIAQDEVEHLGNFVEVRADSEDDLFQVLALLELEDAAMKQSYLDLMLAKRLPPWKRKLVEVHDSIGELSFGIISGILTTVGVLIGVNSASSSKLAVFAAIVSIGVADSCSDAFGIYNAKISERGNSASAAFRYALGTFVGKFIMPFSFLFAIWMLPLLKATIVDLVWAVIVLSLLSAEQAVIGEKSLLKNTGRNLGMALMIVILSYAAGQLVRSIK